MPKRLTVTEKWNDEWYISLTPQAKIIWTYICDNCDLSGVWEANIELLRFRMKFSNQVDIMKHLGEFNDVSKKLGMDDRIEWFSDRKRLWIRNFIKVQYGVLGVKSSTHRGVIKVINSNSLLKGLPKGYITLIGEVKAIAKDKCIEMTEEVREVGMSKVLEAFEVVRNDRAWMDQVCMSHSLKTPDLERWMAKYNASISNDAIDGFNANKYRKMFSNWLSYQEAKGIKLSDKAESEPNHYSRLKKIS